MIKSINYSQEEIIRDILKLHCNNGNIECDPTYSKGVFYKNITKPQYKSDLNPKFDDILKADAANLPYQNEVFNTMMIDLPFVISGRTFNNSKDGCKISKRFACYYSWEELKQSYSSVLKEAFRVLKDNGILIFKLQNTISSGKQYMTHLFTMKEAIKHGFYIKDEFILLAKNRMNSMGGRWKKQQHSRKYHSIFLVLQKKNKSIINYENE